jgi:hypothetical protein
MLGARSIGRVTALLLAACLAFAQTAPKTTAAKTTSAAAKKKPAAVASRRPVAGANNTAKTTAHTRTAAGVRKVVVTRKLVHGKWVRTTQIVHSEPPAPSFQTHPDTDRYQQIQQALAQKGYFKGEANGTWGDDSVAALKQYQTDQKIPNDGKITSLSLIGLGLGPNRETAAVKTEPVAQR